ncbi:Zn-dependent protease with chaperone function [Richelia intracellularis HH01]|uniref:Zn-dependent protease with chaperone function n=1 Tax=Richelia intracellularis HH01 TaxID=1165094 RepID=M1WYC8_9NOST|nr:M48 family metallopeptidase [Richelia intracellularis]CCH66782.1 Zn-dependent protease with chaperone function [Richelia intracellularis HH01]HAE06138.1 peptidase M48 [Richelia sp.]
MSSSKISLIGLKADAFRHPLDLKATQALKKIPGTDLIIRNFLGPVVEQVFHVENISSSVLLGEKQLPQIYELLVSACKILDIQIPRLYIRSSPTPNAYTFAMRGKQPFIVVHTALIDMLTLEEIQAVIAHELGHLKCDHSVYLTPVNLLMLAVTSIPNIGEVIAQVIQNQLLEWLRCAEFTCDRAALLVSQDPRVVMSALMKLAGGSPYIAPQLNVDAFIAQACDYEELSNNKLGEMIKTLINAQLTHPVPVIRAKEIELWANSQEYQRLLQNHKMCYHNK